MNCQGDYFTYLLFTLSWAQQFIHVSAYWKTILCLVNRAITANFSHCTKNKIHNTALCNERTCLASLRLLNTRRYRADCNIRISLLHESTPIMSSKGAAGHSFLILFITLCRRMQRKSLQQDNHSPVVVRRPPFSNTTSSARTQNPPPSSNSVIAYAEVPAHSVDLRSEINSSEASGMTSRKASRSKNSRHFPKVRPTSKQSRSSSSHSLHNDDFQVMTGESAAYDRLSTRTHSGTLSSREHSTKYELAHRQLNAPLLRQPTPEIQDTDK